MIDLKNGFHHVGIKKDHQKYVGFFWKGHFYVWQVLAFGIKIAPYYFNKILHLVLTFLQNQNIRSSIFVDDFLIMMLKSVTTDHKEFV